MGETGDSGDCGKYSTLACTSNGTSSSRNVSVGGEEGMKERIWLEKGEEGEEGEGSWKCGDVRVSFRELGIFFFA